MFGAGTGFFLSLLMHFEYKVRLADHDFAVCMQRASTILINSQMLFHIPALRSWKHDSSRALIDYHDLKRLKLLDNFKSVMCTPDGKVKPIFIVARG